VQQTLTSIEAPLGIKKGILSHPDGAGLQAYAESVRVEMSAIYSSMADKTHNLKRIGVTSDDISGDVDTMLQYVQTI
jgi:hypothetical protein